MRIIYTLVLKGEKISEQDVGLTPNKQNQEDLSDVSCIWDNSCRTSETNNS